jgi:hypothetical protein
MRKLLYGLLAATLALGGAFAQDKKPDDKKPDEKKTEDKKPDAPAPAAGTAVASDYYPLAKGSKWTYTMGATEVVVEVTAVDAKDGSAKLETKHSGKTVASETIVVKADGIYRTKINDTVIDGGGVKILALKDGKATKGDKWDVKAKVQASEVSGSFETKDVAKATAGGKDYPDTAYVEGPKFTIAGTDTAVKYWFAPKTGIVKLSYSIGGTESTPLELKSFEAGK